MTERAAAVGVVAPTVALVGEWVSGWVGGEMVLIGPGVLAFV